MGKLLEHLETKFTDKSGHAILSWPEPRRAQIIAVRSRPPIRRRSRLHAATKAISPIDQDEFPPQPLQLSRDR